MFTRVNIKQKGPDTFVHTDFEGCRESRRSTKEGVACYGERNVKHRSNKQTAALFSTGVAKLYWNAAGLAQGLSIPALAKELGSATEPTLHSDATALTGTAILAGKTRYSDCTGLWVQATT